MRLTYHLLLLDTRFLTAEIAIVEDTGSTYHTYLFDLDAFDKGRGDGEYTFHTHSVGDLTDGECLGGTFAATLYHDAFEALETFFVTFDDFVSNGDRVTAFEGGVLLQFAIESVLSHFDKVFHF